MRGLDQLIALRMRRQMPDSVLVALHHGIPAESVSGSVLSPAHSDSPEKAELRALVGLSVVVCGDSSQADAVTAWAQACERAGCFAVKGYATDGHTLRDKAPIYVGGNLDAIEARIAKLEAALG